jgi:hypothetical protein
MTATRRRHGAPQTATAPLTAAGDYLLDAVLGEAWRRRTVQAARRLAHGARDSPDDVLAQLIATEHAALRELADRRAALTGGSTKVVA